MAKSFPANPILLAEDRDDDVALIKRAFKTAQIDSSIQVVNDGEQAVAYLQGVGAYADRDAHRLPDLLLLDLSMPRMNGFEVLKWIRQQPGLKSLRVIILTASENLQDMKRAWELGANSYLVKPADLRLFVSLIDALHKYWLEADKAPQISRPPPPAPERLPAV